jgi:hypothetical protein
LVEVEVVQVQGAEMEINLLEEQVVMGYKVL